MFVWQFNCGMIAGRNDTADSGRYTEIGTLFHKQTVYMIQKLLVKNNYLWLLRSQKIISRLLMPKVNQYKLQFHHGLML